MGLGSLPQQHMIRHKGLCFFRNNPLRPIAVAPLKSGGMTAPGQTRTINGTVENVRYAQVDPENLALCDFERPPMAGGDDEFIDRGSGVIHGDQGSSLFQIGHTGRRISRLS